MPNVEQLVEAYVRARDKKTEMARRHKEELAPLNAMLQKLEGMLQQNLQEQNVQSMKTGAGTAFLQTESRATVRDWSETLDFIQENGEWSFLEARVNKTAVKDFIESTGEVPPGVDFSETIVTRVRR